ncbi:MAG: nucleotidyltransferase family protein [Anaerolineaceae bacterium]|nr:nucleotidyltransferase family protein [Anaerolineaceae bacterium]
MKPILFNLSESQKMLCSVLSNSEPEDQKESLEALFSQIGDKGAFEMAKVNGVSSIIAHALMDAFGEDNVSIHWINEHETQSIRISAYFEELDRLTALLAKNDIPLIALKNGGIARGIYHCLGCCPMGDIDTLVEKVNFRRAHEILLKDGYQFEFRSPLEETEISAAENAGGAEYWKILPGGEKFWLELQWRPIAGRWIRPDQEPRTEDLMKRSISIDGTKVRMLSPEDNLLQVALHTAKHSYVRAPGFRLHFDVVRIVEGQPVDWEKFVNRVIQLQVKTPVYFSLMIPKELFNAPIPDIVLERIRPARWKVWSISKWLQKVGLFNPDEKKFGRIGYILFTALLYDDFKGLLRSIFPSEKWMREREEGNKDANLIFLYLKRFYDLAFRRLQS